MTHSTVLSASEKSWCFRLPASAGITPFYLGYSATPDMISLPVENNALKHDDTLLRRCHTGSGPVSVDSEEQSEHGGDHLSS